MKNEQGEKMHKLVARLFGIGRSLTGNGVRETLRILKEYIPLTIHEVPTGTKAFDWVVPNEWNVKEAYIIDPNGVRMADYRVNNLHLVGYSVPINKKISLAELQKHLHSIEAQPDAIPYVTSYYEKRWGFCISHKERQSLKEGNYHVFIDSELKKGSLTYGDLVIPGSSKKEILLSTYICHPSMANNELSGPVLAVELARWIMSAPRKYTYRVVFVPETLGSLLYLAKYYKHLKEKLIAGFVLTCVGDERNYSFIPSRLGNTLADRIALRVLRAMHPDFKHYSYLERGSDERIYCSPGADLPVVVIMRTKFGVYPEYHTSLDDLSVVTAVGLQGSFDMYKMCINTLERETLYRATYIGEPKLSKRGLHPTLSVKSGAGKKVKTYLDILAYADGVHCVVDIAEILHISVKELNPHFALLKKHRLLDED